MFWLIIAGILFVLGIVLIIYNKVKWDENEGWGIVCLIVSLVIGLIWYGGVSKSL